VVRERQVEDNDQNQRGSHVVALPQRPGTDLDRPAIHGTRRRLSFAVRARFGFLRLPEMALEQRGFRCGLLLLLFVLRLCSSSLLFLAFVGARQDGGVSAGGELLGIRDTSLHRTVLALAGIFQFVVLVQIQ